MKCYCACPECGEKIGGELGENAYCDKCKKEFSTDWDMDIDAEGSESYYCWTTGEVEV